MGKKKQAVVSGQTMYRTRIKEFIRECPTDTLKEHPQNWRLHPEMQKTILDGMLSRIGKIDAIIAYESEKYGGLVIIDGHLRHSSDATYPVMVLDVNDSEASEILMTYNPLADMAGTDQELYRNIVATIDAEELQANRELALIAKSVLGEEVVASSDSDSATLKRVDVKAPPQMIWVVVGVPVNEFGSVNAIVEQLQIVPNVLVEMTPSDWKPPLKPVGK